MLFDHMNVKSSCSFYLHWHWLCVYWNRRAGNQNLVFRSTDHFKKNWNLFSYWLIRLIPFFDWLILAGEARERPVLFEMICINNKSISFFQQGFKTTQLKLIGPALILIGSFLVTSRLLCCLLKTMKKGEVLQVKYFN